MIYDKKLLNLLNKYNIQVIDDTKLNDNLEGIIIDALTKKCKNKTVALWGAGQNNTKSSHAAILITKYATFFQNMVCVIDSDVNLQGKTFLSFPIIAPNQMSNYKIDMVIIASKNSAESIKKSLFHASPDCEYIDIYEELRNKGIEVYHNFFDENSIYSQIYEVQESYLVDNEEHKLNQLISLYLNIKDFYYAKKYLQEYIEFQYTNYQKYEELMKELDSLIEEIRNINEKREDDISLFYIDALRANEVFDIESGESSIFNQYSKNGKSFTNMYSTAVTTYESMMSIIAGKYPLESEVYTNDYLHDMQEFQLLSNYDEKGYEINLLVSDCYRIIKDTKRINFYNQLYMSQKLWTLVCKLAESNKNTFNFIYFPYETHFPLLCGFHKERPVIKAFSDLGINEFPSCIERQYHECVDYTNIQFDFYYDLIGSKTLKVLFSDHSQVVYDPNNCNKTYNMYYKFKELTTHVPLIISKDGWESECINDLYSMVDFNKICEAVINKEQIKDLSKDIIRYQYYPMHNPKMREHAYKYGFNDFIDGIDVFMSNKYLYIKTATGKEEVYKLSNIEDNIYESEEGQAFIYNVKITYEVAY